MDENVVSQVVEAFGREFGISDARLDAYGSWSFVADDLIVSLQVSEDGSVIECFSFLGEIEHPVEELYETLLEANFFFRGTHGATIGVSSTTHVITLAYRIPVGDLDESRFFRIMENFINVSAHWREQIARFRKTSPEGGYLLRA